MDYREFQRLSRDPLNVKLIAAQIKAALDDELSPNAIDFVARLQSYDGSDPLSTREQEWLSSLRDRSSVGTDFGGYNLREMVCRAFEARLDLNNEDAEAWIEDLHATGPEVRLSLSDRRRLLFWLRQLGLIEEWVDLR